MAGSSENGNAAGLEYPEPLVLQSLKPEHKSTLIMLHGLGEEPPPRRLQIGQAELLFEVVCARVAGAGATWYLSPRAAGGATP